jgi:hypothetical protein
LRVGRGGGQSITEHEVIKKAFEAKLSQDTSSPVS